MQQRLTFRASLDRPLPEIHSRLRGLSNERLENITRSLAGTADVALTGFGFVGVVYPTNADFQADTGSCSLPALIQRAAVDFDNAPNPCRLAYGATGHDD